MEIVHVTSKQKVQQKINEVHTFKADLSVICGARSLNASLCEVDCYNNLLEKFVLN